MIPIACPNCGREGSVPPDRLHAQLRCRGCDAMFHMDRGGRMVLGAIGADDKGGKAKKPKKPKSRHTAEHFSLSEVLEEIPKPVQIGIPILAVVLLVGYFGWKGFAALTAPPSPKTAGEILTKAIGEGQRDRVLAYSTPETKDDAGKFYDLVQDRLKKQLKVKQVIDSSGVLMYWGKDQHEATTMATFVGQTDDTASPTATEFWNLHMTQDKGGNWLLDGKQTLEEALPTKRKYEMPKAKK